MATARWDHTSEARFATNLAEVLRYAVYGAPYAGS